MVSNRIIAVKLRFQADRGLQPRQITDMSPHRSPHIQRSFPSSKLVISEFSGEVLFFARNSFIILRERAEIILLRFIISGILHSAILLWPSFTRELLGCCIFKTKLWRNARRIFYNGCRSIGQ